jgi:thiol-disulfide isomerase/thioredoxin
MEHKDTKTQRLFMLRAALCAFVSLCSVIFLLMLGACSMSDDDDDSGSSEVKEYVKVGDRVPVFSVDVVDAEGRTSTFSTAQLTGETVIVLFNTSCGDCQRELPRLNDYYLEHRNDAGFQMVAISREEEPESVAAFWKEKGLSMPYSPQPDRRIYGLFASAVIPRVYFCGADGIITKVLIEKW